MASGDRKIKKNYNSVFDKISKEKRERILDIVLTEFAANGYSAANINNIAKKADISIGSLYRYFDSKENLFLSIVEILHTEVENGMQKVLSSNASFFEKLETLFRDCQRRSEYFKKLNHIYLDLSTEGLAALSQKLSTRLEEISAFTYRILLEEAKKSGEVDPDMDTSILSFFIDNLIIMFHFSYTTEYHTDRMKIYLNEEAHDDEKLLQAQLYFLKKALAPVDKK